MNARKNYNSIVFLTVYLGLALVGASPQVLAQAATARQFDVKTEIEFKDDLDNKPDGEQALAEYSFVLQDLYSLTKEFADANSDKLRGADYEFDCAVDVYPNTSKKYFCPGGSGLYSNIFFPALNRINEIFPHTEDREKEQVRVNMTLSGDSFLVKITLNQDYERQAAEFHNYYKSALSAPKLKRTDNLKAVVYENTSVSFGNNQVFIVTRLPRASIEPLIADKNAQ